MMKSCPPITPLPLQPAVSRPVPPAPRAKVAATSAFVARLRELGFATREDLAALVDGAPETLDTLRELAERLGSEGDVLARLVDDVESLRLRPAPVQPDWSEGDPESGAFIRNRPALKPVATSGSYRDLTDRPTIPAPVTVDSALSGTSTNPVQNKVVTETLAEKLSRAEVDNGFTEWRFDPPTINGKICSVIFDEEQEFPGWELYLDNEPTSEVLHLAEDETQLVFDDNYSVTATRTRLPTMADIPTKTSDLTNDGSDGAHPFISQNEVQHQQLTPVYSQTPTFSEWTVAPSPSGSVSITWVPNSGIWQIEDDDIGDMEVSSADGENATELLFGGYTATRTRTDIVGYTLGSQTTKPLQPQGDYAVKSEMSITPGTGANADKTTIQLKTGTSATVLTGHQTWSDVKPSGGIPATDLASAAQTSLGKADTAVQPAGIAEKMPMYPFSEPTLTGGWNLPQDALPVAYNIEGSANTISTSDIKFIYEGEDDLALYDRANNQYLALFSYSTGAYVGKGPSIASVTFGGETPSSVGTPFPVALHGYTATVSPYTSATYTATSTAAAFEITVGALPTGVTGKVRDCILVIDCTAAGAVAPTVTWGTHFHPRTDAGTDLAIVEAGKRAVFYISEYVPGEFAVGGWVETDGGSGT